jgi:hypothetical protein
MGVTLRRFGQFRLLGALLLSASAMSSAELWIGQLFDGNCVGRHSELEKYQDCIPAGGTVSFTLQASGRMLKLDAAGNRKAAQAWKQYVDQSRLVDPDLKTKPVTAVVEGTANGDEIKVDSILLR